MLRQKLLALPVWTLFNFNCPFFFIKIIDLLFFVFCQNFSFVLLILFQFCKIIFTYFFLYHFPRGSFVTLKCDSIIKSFLLHVKHHWLKTAILVEMSSIKVTCNNMLFHDDSNNLTHPSKKKNAKNTINLRFVSHFGTKKFQLYMVTKQIQSKLPFCGQGCFCFNSMFPIMDEEKLHQEPNWRIDAINPFWRCFVFFDSNGRDKILSSAPKSKHGTHREFWPHQQPTQKAMSNQKKV